jgi:hypothetical protein
MTRRRNVLAAGLSFVAMTLPSLTARADDATPSLPRNTVVPLSAVTEYFPDVTKEAGMGWEFQNGTSAEHYRGLQ